MLSAHRHNAEAVQKLKTESKNSFRRYEMAYRN